MLERLLGQLRGLATTEAEIPVLQPADPFLETAGEDMRRRIFLTETVDGEQKCLRPEFTIPICLHHENGAARYAYGGMVFRQNRDGANEFLQAGLEDLGNPDSVQADADALADMLEALAELGLEQPTVSLGDQKLFGVVVESLELPQAVAARLVRNFGEADQLDRLISELSSDQQNGCDKSRALELALAQDTKALVGHVSELMENANLSAYAGRSPDDIAARMISKAQEASFRLDNRRADILRQFLTLEIPLADAAAQLAEFAQSADLKFGDSLEQFKERTKRIARRGVALESISYKASFGRKLDYYTGVLFEAEVGGVSVAGGGRYDHLCTLLGRSQPVPAVGFSISLDRVEEART